MVVGSISRLVSELILINELTIKCEGSLHTIDSRIILKKIWHFRWVFGLLPLNYLVEGYNKLFLN